MGPKVHRRGVVPKEEGLAALVGLFDERAGMLGRLIVDRSRHGNLGGAVRLEQLANVSLERSLRHTMFFVGIKRVFGEEEVILAIDIAGRSAGFG
jgi:hypothetical protein